MQLRNISASMLIADPIFIVIGDSLSVGKCALDLITNDELKVASQGSPDDVSPGERKHIGCVIELCYQPWRQIEQNGFDVPHCC